MEETDEYDSVQWDIQDATTGMDDSSPLGKSRHADTATIDPLSDIADSMNSTLKLDNNFESQNDSLASTSNLTDTYSTNYDLNRPVFNPYLESQLAPTTIYNNPSTSAYKTTHIITDRNIRVSDPEKETDGQSTYMSYLITSDKASVRRRFQDFVWLYNVLNAHFPACFVPSLPEKHRMEYVRGDRFGGDFVEKRRASLQNFVERIGRHPILSNAEFFEMFLESPKFNDTSARALREQQETMLDTFSDSLLNAFSKIKNPDERFVNMKEQLDKLEENLTLIEKTLNRTNKRQEELSQDYKEFASSMQGLANLESGITVPILRFAETATEYSRAMKNLSDKGEADWISEIHEYIAYCTAVKTVLKLRDQKQVDYEELTEYLAATEKERERTMHPSMMDRGLNITGYLTDKIQEARGIDSEKMRREKILKLDMRIRELQEATEQSKEVSTSFSDQVEREYKYFEESRTVEIKNALEGYTGVKTEFYTKALRDWKDVINTLEAIHVEEN
ncbi:hypothetical protein K450DRAFT_239293 [Umbelopsis ramanniana AG]|uniref:Sorting nexin-4 n=1 Tax=Umbelopsis ramanniana AG TaxID=1314678 RepID=A0AAD5HFJ9_UMBRA|nr:uncharacterized protein K450DRAFT_239293 [Umbelopsis ramanniana AG]KAI8580083.1 hypothetical protein K450DRAFT_239293 [Umbelopsis ramanniana AG]